MQPEGSVMPSKLIPIVKIVDGDHFDKSANNSKTSSAKNLNKEHQLSSDSMSTATTQFPKTSLTLSKYLSVSSTALVDQPPAYKSHNSLRHSLSEIELNQVRDRLTNNPKTSNLYTNFLSTNLSNLSEIEQGSILPLDSKQKEKGCFKGLKCRLTVSSRRRQNCRRRLNRLMYFMRVFLTHLFSTTGLCFLVVIYSCLGATIFVFLESQNEKQVRDNMNSEHVKCASDLWNYTLELNLLYPELWKQKAIERIQNFEKMIINAVHNDGYGSGVDQWSFSGALLYSVTVITTIGYGNVTCKTDWGRIATIIYAIIGIPITFLCLANLGNLMAETFRFSYKRIGCCRCFCTNRMKKKVKKGKYNVTMNRNEQSHHRNTKTNEHLVIQLNSLNKPSYENVTTKEDVGLNEKQSMLDINHESQRKCSLDGNKDIREDAKLSQKQIVSVQNDDRKLPTTEMINTLLTLTCEMDSDGSEDNLQIEDILIEGQNKERVPIWLVFTLMIGYIILGAFMFSIWEDWGPIEGAYFCFTTLTTIGFGDLVPGSAKLSYHKDGQTKFIICCVYMMVGLSLIAMSFNLVQEEIVIKCQRIGRRLGIMPTMSKKLKYRPKNKAKQNRNKILMR